MDTRLWDLSQEPKAMLDDIAKRAIASPRKLRLFACSTYSAAFPRTEDYFPFSQALALAEGAISAKDAIDRCQKYTDDPGFSWSDWYLFRKHAVDSATFFVESAAGGLLTPVEKADLLREIFGNPYSPPATRCPECRGKGDVRKSEIYASRWDREECGTCRGAKTIPLDISSTLPPFVLDLARAAYDEQGAGGRLDKVRLAVLADALEEHGCTERRLLAHLRSLTPCVVCYGEGVHHTGLARCDAYDIHDSRQVVLDCLGCKATGFVPMKNDHFVGCWALDLVRGET